MSHLSSSNVCSSNDCSPTWLKTDSLVLPGLTVGAAVITAVAVAVLCLAPLGGVVFGLTIGLAIVSALCVVSLAAAMGLNCFSRSSEENSVTSSNLDKTVKTTTSHVIVNPDTQRKIFDAIKSNTLGTLKSLFAALNASERLAYLSSTQQFNTQWAYERKECMTPLQYACDLGNLDMVRFLVENGARVNDKQTTSLFTERGSLHFALDSKHPECALYLLSKGAKDGKTACHIKWGRDNYSLPLEGGTELENLTQSRGSSCLYGIHMAVMNGYHEVVRALLQADPSLISVKTSGGHTPFQFARRYQKDDAVMTDLLVTTIWKT